MATFRQQFQQLQQHSHTSIVRAQLWYGGSLIQDDIPVTAGSISIDSSRAVRRTTSLTIIDKTGDLIPKKPGDPLAPYGAEIRVKRGYIYNSGKSKFYWQMGVFRIATAEVEDDGEGISIAITGYDRSRAFSLNRFETAYAIAPGTSVVQAIADIIALQNSGIGLALQTQTSNDGTVGAVRVIDAESDPWAAIQSLANDIGCEVRIDSDGNCVLRDIPNPITGIVQDTYQYGELSKFTKATNALTDDPGYNGVVVTGEAPGYDIVESTVWDDNPDSPTYYLGPYGKRPIFYRSQYMYLQAQADATAQAQFYSNVGITEQAKFEAVPNPFLNEGDIIETVHEDIGLNDKYVVETVDMPLGESDAMAVTCQKQVFV